MTPVELVLSRLSNYKESGKGWSALCPAHEDRNPSLSISEGDDGRALIKCHAGCSADSICASLSLKLADLMPQSAPTGKAPRDSVRSTVVAEYDYKDESGTVIFQVQRLEPKGFRQRKPKPGGGWENNVSNVRKLIYRLPELLADPNGLVIVVEGEKDVDNLRQLGFLATCNPGGAGKWTGEHSAFLRGRAVVVLPDNDETGRAHAENVAQSLQGIAEAVRIVALPDLPLKGDASDWIAAGGSRDALMGLVKAAPNWTPPAVPQEWPELQPFDGNDLPEFPTHVLPAPLRNWVGALSHATQTPPDLAGLLSLAVCAAAIARQVVVSPREGWEEPTNLFVAVLQAPANRKSAVFSDVTKPLKEIEAELINESRPLIARAQSERRQSEKRLRKLEKSAGEESGADERAEALDLAEQLSQKRDPVPPRLIVDDATSEKLGIMLAEQNGRIASMSAEGGVFDLMAGLYSKSGIAQFDTYLKGHSGDDLITDRVSRGTVQVKDPALTCAYAMQPQVLEGIADNAAFRGRGLLGRFLYAAPKSWIGEREIAPAPVPTEVRAAYSALVREMFDSRRTMGNVLRLTAAAEEKLRDWEEEIEGMLADGGDMEIMTDWGGKLAGATLRLSAVLHCAEYGVSGEIGVAVLMAAIEIARYLIPHADFVINMMQAQEKNEDEDAKYILKWIRRHEKKEFTQREVHQHGKRRFKKADDVGSALFKLQERGYIRPLTVQRAGPGRPQSPKFEVNPRLFESGRAKDPQNSQNQHGESGGSDSEIIEEATVRIEEGDRLRVSI